MDDWWQLIDKNAARHEQFPSLRKVLLERPGGQLARRLDADHEYRKYARKHPHEAAHDAAMRLMSHRKDAA